MKVLDELKTLYHLTLAPIRGKTAAERLENFYAGQAKSYDQFRDVLLKGRQPLWQALPIPDRGVWLDLGGGTGSNLEYLGENIRLLSKIYVVDLSSSLLDMARRRIAAKGWKNVEAIQADVTEFVPPEGQVDVVTFSYSLTMIPDWFAAVDRAYKLLRPGGVIGVVDFYVSRKYPDDGLFRHPWATRALWPLWFGFDNVFPSPDHVPYLQRRFDQKMFSEHMGKIPYLPGLKAPYYMFIGRKTMDAPST